MTKKKSESRDPDIQFDYRRRSDDLPATQAMLQMVRGELKAEMRSVFCLLGVMRGD